MYELRERDGQYYFIPFELVDEFDDYTLDCEEYLIDNALAERIIEEESYV